MPRDALSRVVQYLRSAALRMGGPDHTDAQLLAAFAERRDEVAAEILVRRHGPMVLGVCRRILRNEADAEDAFQATFLVLVRKAASIRPRHMVGNWLYGVARQTALRAKVAAAKRWRKEKRMGDLPERIVAADSTGNDLLALLDQELTQLPAKYRSAIVLCDLEGKTYKEAARRLGCPEGTLSARLVRGRTMLAKRLKRHGFAISGGALAGIMAEKAAAGGLPPTLAASTIKIVNLSVAASGTAIGAVSATVAGLTESVVRTMLLAKLKITLGLVVAAALIATTTGRVIIATDAAQPAAHEENQAPIPNKNQAEPDALLVAVASPVSGIVQFIGTEIQPGEKVPANREISIKVNGELKRYRRLVKADRVKEGQLLARVENKTAQLQWDRQDSIVKTAKAEFDRRKAIAGAAKVRFETATRLLKTGGIELEDYRSAMFAFDIMRLDSVSKKQHLEVAQAETARAKTLWEMQEIRSRVSGVIKSIEKRPGEAARKFETVMIIEVAAEPGAIAKHYSLRIPCPSQGIVQFIGTEVKAGEDAPRRNLFTVESPGRIKKTFRRLQLGEQIKKGQVLGQLDDRLARIDLAIKESKLYEAAADLDGAKAIADEAMVKWQTAHRLFKTGSIANEEFRAAKLVYDKFHLEVAAKRGAVTGAQSELILCRELLDQHQIRATASGILSAIRKHPGEAVQEFDTVVEIEVPEKND